MGKIVIAFFSLCLIVFVGLAYEVAGEDSEGEMCIPMGVITIKPPEGVDAKKSPVEFPHSQHFVTDCKSCHHKWQGEGNIQGCMTSGCHDQIEATTKSGKYLSYSNEAIKFYKYAYHQACIGCHKKIREDNRKLEKSYQVIDEKLPTAGPSGCVECHPSA